MALSKRNYQWKQKLDKCLLEFGHRNWIVIADAAYPAQSNAGIETIATSCGHFDVLDYVLRSASKQLHVRPQIYIDSELKAVAEADAPGVQTYRQQLKVTFGRNKVTELPHEKIIAKLDAAASLFRVLVLKSTFTIPYTSVFLEFDCGYWSADRELRLRQKIACQSENG